MELQSVLTSTKFAEPYPLIIQGGMGVAVSGYKLARAVSACGQLGVVSGTALDAVLARRLQMGDPTGELREAIAAFPLPEVAQRILDAYYIPKGKGESKSFKSIPIYTVSPPKALTDLTIVANFVEVWLAKRGHSGPVGINYLEKIQLPTLPSLYGAMLAEVDVVIMGAGIPRAIPAIIDQLAGGEVAHLKIDVTGGQPYQISFDPREYLGGTSSRPKFLAIVSSASLAQVLAKKCTSPVDGLIIEGPTAGGHNAPPRGALQLSESGEPIYGERDVPDLEKIAALGLPFWLAGGYGTATGLKDARAAGAVGIQVGTPFAFCEESGIEPALKSAVLGIAQQERAKVFTDGRASPTGFPFKVLQMSGTISEKSLQDERERVCDLGYLREVYQDPTGHLGYRCSGEPLEKYIAKGGTGEETEGRKCVCNGLLATIGLGQSRKGKPEYPLITAGDEVASVSLFLKPGKQTYSARDVLEKLLTSEPHLGQPSI